MTAAADYRQEFTKVGEGLACTCRDLMAEFIKRGEFGEAAKVAETGDLVGHLLASLTRIADRA